MDLKISLHAETSIILGLSLHLPLCYIITNLYSYIRLQTYKIIMTFMWEFDNV